MVGGPHVRPAGGGPDRRPPEGSLPTQDGDGVTWILGSSRSGSTWLTRMVSEHPRLATVDETHIGHHLGVWRPISLAWAVGRRPGELTTILETYADHDDYLFARSRRPRWLPSLRELLLGCIEARARDWERAHPDADLRGVVVKEPSGSEVADLLLELLPASRLLFLVRDGRDVVTSWLAAYQPGGWILEEGGFELTDDDRCAFIAWQAEVWRYRVESVQRAFDSLPPERRLLVRYEDLVADTPDVLRGAFDFLDVEYEDADLERAVRSHALDQVPEDERGPRSHIRSGRVGQWQRELAADEQASLGDRLGPVLARYGYRS